jgi:uncharacterized protein (DUF302 family)
MRAIETTVDAGMEPAEAAVRAALAEQGFGVLTEIDVAATLRDKLGVQRPPLRILGACNPELAHRALGIDPAVSLLLPCNVVLEPAAGGGTRVAVADPRELMDAEEFRDLADAAAERLRVALDGLAGRVAAGSAP